MINIFGVRWFGEAEFFFSIIKCKSELSVIFDIRKYSHSCDQ